LGGSTQKTTGKPCQAVGGEPPGEAGNQTAEWDCVLHSLTKTRLEWKICTLYVHVHTIYRGPEHAGNQQSKSL